MPTSEQKKYTLDVFFVILKQNEAYLEFINGEIVSQTAPTELHQDIVFQIHHCVYEYIRKHQGRCKAISAPLDVVLGDNVIQPDFMVICDSSKRDGKRCIGATDWVVEVVSSDTQRDYVKKLAIYQEAGVWEY